MASCWRRWFSLSTEPVSLLICLELKIFAYTVLLARISLFKMPAEWEIIRDECQKRRRDAIPTEFLLSESHLQDLPKDRSTLGETSGHFSDIEKNIINAPAREIVANIKEGIWSAVNVTRAFCKSAAVAQQLVSIESMSFMLHIWLRTGARRPIA